MSQEEKRPEGKPTSVQQTHPRRGTVTVPSVSAYKVKPSEIGLIFGDEPGNRQEIGRGRVLMSELGCNRPLRTATRSEVRVKLLTFHGRLASGAPST